MKKFIDDIKLSVFNIIDSELQFNDWVILKSLKNCKEQLPHMDYIPTSNFLSLPDEYVPLSIIVSIMDGTKINVWPRSIKYNLTTPIKKKTLFLKKGNIFYF